MATSVKFGDVDATAVTFVSDTEIIATTPAGTAGAVDVTVTTSGGTDTLTTGFEYTEVALAASRRRR